MSMDTCGCGKAIDTDYPETYSYNPKTGECVCQSCIEEEDLDQCEDCGIILNDEDDIIEENSVPYGDTFVNEQIVIGYKCPECGHEGGY